MTVGEIAQLVVAVATLVTAVGGFVVAIRTGSKVEATHELVNGHSEALNSLTGKAAYAEGLLAGGALAAQEPPQHVGDDAPPKDVLPGTT